MAAVQEHRETNLTLDAGSLASIVNGRWQKLPAPDWSYCGLCYGGEDQYSPGRLLLLKSNRVVFGVSRSTIISRRWVEPVVVSADASIQDLPNPVLRVVSIEDFLDRLSIYCRTQYPRPIVAVTGSVGKSSSVDLLCHLLGQHLKVTSNHQRNFSEGVVCAMANLVDSDCLIAEVSGGAIGPASISLRPHVVVLTHISPAHMESNGSLEGLIERKSSLLDHLAKNGTAVINTDIPAYDKVLERARKATKNVLSFGASADADFRFLSYRADARRVKATILGVEVEFELGLPGRHMAINSLGVLAACHALGCDFSALKDPLRTAVPVEGRGNVLRLDVFGKKIIVINDSFNANPASMRAALSGLIEWRGGEVRKAVALTDMLELGGEALDYHRDLSAQLNDEEIDRVYLAGSLMFSAWEKLAYAKRGKWRLRPRELIYPILHNLESGDVLLIKGSHGSGAHKLVHDLVYFDGLRGVKRLVIWVVVQLHLFYAAKAVWACAGNRVLAFARKCRIY